MGERFISEALDAFTVIERHPHRYGRCRYRSRRELRRHYLKHFPHAVVYEVREDECVAVAIAHPSRRPNYWHERLK